MNLRQAYYCIEFVPNLINSRGFSMFQEGHQNPRSAALVEVKTPDRNVGFPKSNVHASLYGGKGAR